MHLARWIIIFPERCFTSSATSERLSRRVFTQATPESYVPLIFRRSNDLFLFPFLLVLEARHKIRERAIHTRAVRPVARIPDTEIAYLRVRAHTGWKQTNRVVRTP